MAEAGHFTHDMESTPTGILSQTSNAVENKNFGKNDEE
jgi:hypothetical protein